MPRTVWSEWRPNGASEVKLLGDGDEVAQAAQLDDPRLTPAGCQTASKGCWTWTYTTQTMTAWTELPASLNRWADTLEGPDGPDADLRSGNQPRSSARAVRSPRPNAARPRTPAGDTWTSPAPLAPTACTVTW